jgi:hypothetical protein
VERRNPKVKNFASTTTTTQGKFEDSSATDATEGSDTHSTTPTHSAQQQLTSENTLPERMQQIIKWREEGHTYKAIGETLGLTRQRVIELWKLAQDGGPRYRRTAANFACSPEHHPTDGQTCACGNPVLNRKSKCCTPEHAPSTQRTQRTPKPPAPKPPKPLTQCQCGRYFEKAGRQKYCSRECTPLPGFPQLTQSEYDKMWRQQKGLCGICKQPETALATPTSTKTKRLAVDHCHNTGEIRGLLCGNCNVMLGFFDDDPERLEKAADYLGKHAYIQAA